LPPTATPTNTPAPNGGSALDFDGTDDILRTVNLPFSAAFTIEAWVQRTVDTNYYQTFLSDANSTYSQAMFALYIDGAGWDCGGSGDQFAYYQTNGFSAQCSGVAAELGRWYHIAVSRDSTGTRRFFVDGVLRSVQSNTTPPSDSNGVLTFGRGGDYDGEYFGGLIDEVRISNAAIYTADFAPPTAPLSPDPGTTLGLWHLDEGAGQTVWDASDSGYAGTLGSSVNADSADPVWVDGYPWPEQ
jgi:hypothetical protein